MVANDLHIRPIIGLEIHVQLATRTKLFCPCALEFAAEPNCRVCPVCMGMPGTLPVINRTAFDFAVRAGLALNCRIASFSKWDRKSYYYPDLPKNYQISQYDLPIAADGYFEIPVSDIRHPTSDISHGGLKKVGIIRAHLEEDAGKNMHEGLDHTRVDLNRTGTPLLEIVTQPDLTDAEEAYTFCVELQRLVRFLGISEANMQKGQMRFEPNVNVAITDADGREYRTPISEVKNLNSFRSVRSAIQYEINRQAREWESDHDYTLQNKGKMNFGWNDTRECTEFQRGKEESHDYRYFPDPDLVPVTTEDDWLDGMRRAVGELPLTRERRFVSDYEVTAKDCEVLLADQLTADVYENAAKLGADVRTLTKTFLGAANKLASERGVSVGHLPLMPRDWANLTRMVDSGKISATSMAMMLECAVKAREART